MLSNNFLRLCATVQCLLLFLVWFNNFDRFQIYGVTYSYSSRPFMCVLALSRPGHMAGWVYMTKDEDHFDASRHPTDIQICHCMWWILTWVRGHGYEDVGTRTWVWGRGYEDMGMRTWVWGHGYEDVGTRTWVWGHGYEDMGMRTWVWG